MATESDKIIWRQILDPLNLAVKFPPAHFIYLSQDTNGSICPEQECRLSWLISAHNNPKIPTNTDTQSMQAPHRTSPSSDNRRESLLCNVRSGGKAQTIDPDTTATHGVRMKSFLPRSPSQWKQRKLPVAACLSAPLDYQWPRAVNHTAQPELTSCQLCLAFPICSGMLKPLL